MKRGNSRARSRSSRRNGTKKRGSSPDKGNEGCGKGDDSMSKAERTRGLRYKRPALMSMGWEAMTEEIQTILDACSDVQWYIDNDDDTLLNALEGSEDEYWEFKMSFSALSSKAYELYEAVFESGLDGETYDTCTVALLGDCYRMIDYGEYEEDYTALTGVMRDYAQSEAGKRLMRKTKTEMIDTIGQCVGILVAYLDLRQQYDYLNATMQILRDENTSLLQIVREIDEVYEAAMNEYASDLERQRFEQLLKNLPDRAWVE